MFAFRSLKMVSNVKKQVWGFKTILDDNCKYADKSDCQDQLLGSSTTSSYRPPENIQELTERMIHQNHVITN